MELTIISEETVKVLDRHVFKGAGRLTIRFLFAAVWVFALNEVWEFAPKFWATVVWLNDPKNWGAIHSVSEGIFVKSIVSLILISFVIISGTQAVTMAINGVAWLWRKPRFASEQIILAWRETPKFKRIGFVILMLFSLPMLLLMYVFAILWIIHTFI